MSEAGDYDPGPWQGYDFKSARKNYDIHVGRSYDDALSAKKNINDLIEPSLSTDSDSPLVIACDVTGSMGDWPATIFSKLPYLDKEGKEYLGENMAISFAAVGDAYSDHYPLQVRPFDTGTNLEKRLKELVIEGNGGGQERESYDLCGLYYANNVKMPKAVKPIFIYIGDEGLYDFVDKGQAQDFAKVAIEGRLSSKQVLDQLQSKYSVYLVRKPYNNTGSDKMSSTDTRIYNQWASCIGADHISILPDPNRVVDVIFGILANETSRIAYFQEELKGRQRPDQVKTVLKALETIHLPDHKSYKRLKAGDSKLKRSTTGDASKSLI